jgi:hypothetical protein
MTAPTWPAPLTFADLDLHLSDLDVMADLDPNWIGWAAEAVAVAAADSEVAP